MLSPAMKAASRDNMIALEASTAMLLISNHRNEWLVDGFHMQGETVLWWKDKQTNRLMLQAVGIDYVDERGNKGRRYSYSAPKESLPL